MKKEISVAGEQHHAVFTVQIVRRQCVTVLFTAGNRIPSALVGVVTVGATTDDARYL